MNLIGQRYGRLTVIKKEEKVKKDVLWKCICDCGTEKKIRQDNLRKGNTKSCGCLQKERSEKHGLKKINIQLYNVWKTMRNRCNNPKCREAKQYHNRGIRLCDEWQESYESFYYWSVTNGYEKGLTIERIDVNGNYEPSNCKWITIKQQAKNRRNTVYLTLKGITKCLSDWVEDENVKALSITKQVISGRKRMGWTDEKILTTPLTKRKSF